MIGTSEGKARDRDRAAKSLTAAATLSGTSTLLQVGIQLVTGLAITPLVIRGLGRELYGAWAMIQQSLGYVGLANLRATGALKLTLAVSQHEEDVTSKRQEVGAAVGTLFRLAPLFVLAGGMAVWFGPSFVRLGPDQGSAVRWALALGVAAVLVGEVASIPANVLRGMNLEYKAMGVTALVLLLTSLLNLAAVKAGLGLVGLAAASLLGVAVTGAIRTGIARRFVPWLGYERPPAEALKRYWSQSVWLCVGAGGQILQNGSEALVIGVISGPKGAAIYAITGMVLRLASEPMLAAIAAANPGLGGLCGTEEWTRLEGARAEIKLMGTVALLVVTAGVVALNEAFLGLWVGTGYFGGSLLNALLCANAVTNALLRTDAMIADAALRIRERALIFFVAGGGGLAIGALLARQVGPWGLALGVLVGRMGTLLALSGLVERITGRAAREHWLGLSRPLVVGGAIVALCWVMRVDRSSLVLFPAQAAAVGVAATAAVWWLGLAGVQRARLSSRFALQFAAILDGLRRAGRQSDGAARRT